ncbi:glucose 1-dehydrogenase [Bosea sp. LjRoot90]|uniref:SDR family NAD(P)-dependent oxidoreductase n=1 Tax=Bosea sp. LjRoot90 TaxID=3342342 RepID=UPI003ECC384C
MSKKLAGKVAIVTGSSTGIGAAIARALATEGASVVVNYNSDQVGADAVVADIKKAGGDAITIGASVTKKASAQAIVDAAITTFGRLDILVNNAGMHTFGTVEEVTEEQFHQEFELNVLGTMLVTAAAVQHLKAGASIINIGSLAARFPMPGNSVYTASKAAIDGYTSVLAQELGPRGIRANALNPGLTATERVIANGYVGSDFANAITSRTPLGRLGKTEELGKVAVFLASDDSSFITGEHLNVNGGAR